MDGTVPLEYVREAADSSLYLVGQIYARRPNGDLQFNGSRPGPRWQIHGYFSRWLWVFNKGHLQRLRLWKRRWWHPEKGTCHSRPPDDLGRIGACSLVYIVALFGWLCGPQGLSTHEPIFEDLKTYPSTRTLQRWLRRALPNALKTQQAFRLAVIERCEPRPVESLFPRGVSPPQKSRRLWRDPLQVSRLLQAFALILSAAFQLDLPAALLLAEARRREVDIQNTGLF